MTRFQLHALLPLAMLAPLACSPFAPEPAPTMEGPTELTGMWNNYMIICTASLTVTTPYPITITAGEVTARFPARGTRIAKIWHFFTPEELAILWGEGVSGRRTSSLEVIPAVQYRDYEVTVTFEYVGPRGSGVLSHVYLCLADPEDAAPRP